MRSRFAIPLVMLWAMSSPALAHAFLTRADPGAGADVTAPKEISLNFSAKLDAAGSGASITDGSGHAVNAQAAVADSTITLSLPPLAPGEYHLAWHALSVDSHRTEGGYSFTVQP
jgi:methionine-rich copper-binding protein CopC